jgi:hypothetical protein
MSGEADIVGGVDRYPPILARVTEAEIENIGLRILKLVWVLFFYREKVISWQLGCEKYRSSKPRYQFNDAKPYSFIITVAGKPASG